MFSKLSRYLSRRRPALLIAALLLLCAGPGLAPLARAALPDSRPVTRPAGQAATHRIYLPQLDGRPLPDLPLSAHASLLSTARGYLTTPQELRAIRQRAEMGAPPFEASVRALLGQQDLRTPSAWVGDESIGGQPRCSDGSQRDAAGHLLPRGPRFLVEGGRLAYAKMLAAHLTPDAERAAAYARDTRARILDLVDTSGWGGERYSGDNQCILYLSWYIPGFVMAADLLESFPDLWRDDDRTSFQRWLAGEVYPKVAWASRARTNNWGSSGSYAAAAIADYLHDSGLSLREVAPQPRTLTPGEAYAAHTAEQLSRMSAEAAPRDERDSRCLPLKGIQPAGGIPDELRRAKINNPLGMCDAEYLPRIDGGYRAAYTYQITHVEALIAHAELALRRGDRRLYDNLAADGSGSILRAIHFIIQNPAEPRASYSWGQHRTAMLYVANRYYRDPAITRELAAGTSTLRSGELVAYGQVTHADALGGGPSLPPAVPPPGQAPTPLALPDLVASGGQWALDEGVLTLTVPRRGSPGGPHGNLAVAPAAAPDDITLRVALQAIEAGATWNDVAVIFSYRDERNYAYVSLNERNDGQTSGVFVLVDGVAREVADITAPIRTDQWYTLELRKAGDHVNVLLDGLELAAARHERFGQGRVGVGTLNDAAAFAAIQLLPVPSP